MLFLLWLIQIKSSGRTNYVKEWPCITLQWNVADSARKQDWNNVNSMSYQPLQCLTNIDSMSWKYQCITIHNYGKHGRSILIWCRYFQNNLIRRDPKLDWYECNRLHPKCGQGHKMTTCTAKYEQCSYSTLFLMTVQDALQFILHIT